MPGNICLTMSGPNGRFVQYRSQETPDLKLVERRTEDDVQNIAIIGMLGKKLRFTQTLRCGARKMTTTYVIEALAAFYDTTISIAAGPGPKTILSGLSLGSLTWLFPWRGRG